MEIKIIVDHYFHGVQGLQENQFAELKQLLINNQGMILGVQNALRQNLEEVATMASDVRAAVDRLTQKVQSMEDAGQALRTAFSALADEMRANAGDATAINQLADRIEAEQLADAVLAGTAADTGGGASAGGTGGAGGGAPSGGGAEPPAGGGGGATGGSTSPGGTEPGGEPPTARRR